MKSPRRRPGSWANVDPLVSSLVYLIMVYMAASPGISLHWLPSWPGEEVEWWGLGRHSPGGGGGRVGGFILLTLDGAVRYGQEEHSRYVRYYA